MASSTTGMFGNSPGSFWSNGPAPGEFYKFPGNKNMNGSSAAERTLQPVVMGSSVIGLQFKGGVVIASDMLGSYGSLARFRNCPRMFKVNDNTVLGAAGDYADFQHIVTYVEQQEINDQCLDDGFGFTPKSLHCWLTRVLYNRRSQFNPLWNTYIVAGMEEGTPFLGYVDKIGIAYEAPSLACGFGAYIALPIIRETMEKQPDMNKDQALALIDRCMKILFYRDCRTMNKYQVAVITADGVELSGPKKSEANWEVAHMITGYE